MKTLLAAAALSSLLLAPGAGAAPPPKPELLFDVDQGFNFGVTENLDLVGLNRILDALEMFHTRYTVYAIFSPLTAKEENLRRVLEQTAERKVPFFLDVYASDVMAIGNILTPARPDAGPAHARAISLDGLRRLKTDPKIGPFLAGVRFHEFLGIDSTVKTCLHYASGKGRVNWCDHFMRNVVNPNIFKPQEVKAFLDFAKAHQMQVFWSDWNWGSRTASQQQKLRELLQSGEYRDMLVLAFANNWPNETARTNDSKWRDWIAAYAPLIGKEIRGLGLSDQSWTCFDQGACPAAVVDDWAQRAIRSAAVAIELEPANYFFDLPRGRMALGYPSGRGWPEKSGTPRATLLTLAKALGLDATALAAQRKAGMPAHDALCVDFDANKAKAVVGERIRLSAVFQNTGKLPWPAKAVAAASDNKKALIFENASQPLPRRAPGEKATASFEAKLSAGEGPDAISIALRDAFGAVFGQSCEVLVRIVRK